MANIPISALPNVQPSGYTPNDLLVIVNNGVTKNTSLSDISSYVFSGYTFTGNTSATCITDLYVTNIYGCSPINVQNDLILNSVSAGTNSDDILVRTSLGQVKEIPVLGLPFSNVTGLTFDLGTYDLTVGSDNGSAFTQSLSIFGGDLFVTGGTYDPNTGAVTFVNNSGATFSVSGFASGYTDTNIYNSNGSLTGNRTVNLNSYTLDFSSGNVGIGTNSPTQRLSVDGNLNFTNNSFGGLVLNNLTTAQRNALTPAVGTVVYDTDLGVTCTYKGTFWDYTMIKTPSGTGTTTTSTGATNISGLAFSVESGSTYIIEGWISIYCLSTGGVKFGHTFPSGAYAALWLDGINNSATSSIKTGTVGSLLPGTSTGFNSSPATTQFSSVIVKGLITTTNSGTFQLQFARGTGTAANVSITSNTFIKLTKIV